MLVCSGAQHALNCCLSSLFRSGDRIATDPLIYPGMKTLANMLGIRLVPVPMDDQGMIPDQLDRICRREKNQWCFAYARSSESHFGLHAS